MRQGMTARIAMLLMLCIGTATFGWVGSVSAASRNGGAVYALTNATSGNAVVIYERDRDGMLYLDDTVPTGGAGTGMGLGSQGALVLSEDRELLFAVNAGSNDISVFKVQRDGLDLIGRADSGGMMPISLTVHDDTLYVLNAGGTGNIMGFRINRSGKLNPLIKSVRPLSGPATGPAQVQFSPDGTLLAVTEKATNMIDIYRVGKHGMIEGPMVQASVGQTPFGFAFGWYNRLIVSEAFGGAAGAGAVSSYIVSDDGMLHPVSGSLANHQGAPCWVALSENGRFAYVANTGSGTVSAYRVDLNGALSLLNDTGVAGMTGDGTKPADLGLSDGDRFLYVRNGETGTISAFQVQPDGMLMHLSETGMLPAGAAGLAVR